MINEKKIEDAAYKFAASQTHGELLALIDGYKEGFKDAINEFLKDLWHPAEEEPKEKDKLLMVETGKKEHKYVHFKRNQGCMFGEWKHYAHMVDVSRWLYMDDLFPKKE